ncbi:MAG: VTT domain-containing protein, partial [Deltaproteobacteria bacterium]
MSEHRLRNRRKEGLASDLLRFFLVGFIFLALALLLRHGLGNDVRLRIQELRQLLQGSKLPGGLWASGTLFVLLGGMVISLGVPRIWVSGAAGAIYGAILGTTLAMAGSMIGAATVYGMGRGLLGNLVERRFSGQLGLWRRRFQENAFWWVLYGRLFPFSNATLKSLLCGSCRVPFGPYLFGSFLGFIPLTFVFAAFGSGSIKGDINQILLGFGLLLLAWLC